MPIGFMMSMMMELRSNLVRTTKFLRHSLGSKSPCATPLPRPTMHFFPTPATKCDSEQCPAKSRPCQLLPLWRNRVKLGNFSRLSKSHFSMRSQITTPSVGAQAQFSSSHEFRVAAMAKTIAFPIDPRWQLGDPRLILGLLLALIASTLYWLFSSKRSSPR